MRSRSLPVCFFLTTASQSHRLVSTALLICLICVIAPGSTPAQTETATLSGRVTDQHGALLTGVRIEVRNLETDLTTSAETDGQGLYLIVGLRPGRYRLSVNKAGFQGAVTKTLEVHVQDSLSLNFTLQVSPLNELVAVLAVTDPLQDTSAVGVVTNRQSIENLPLNGRSFQTLIELSPGTVITKADSESPGQFSINGQRPSANYITVDGVSANIGVSATISPGLYAGGSLPGLTALGGTNNLVSVDALQEFRIQTSGYAPEFGRMPGGQISLVTRAGTQDFHGTLFDYIRNDLLDANDWFANSRGLARPALRQNDFGGVLGGPLVKNRTFFFFSYEGLRLRQPQTSIVAVPSAAARASASSSIRPFLDAFPIPNGQTLPDGFAEFSGSYSDPSSMDATSLRLDHTASDTLFAFGRFNYSPSEARLRRSALNSVTFSQFKTLTLTGGVTWAVTPHISNEFRANWSRSDGASFTDIDDFGGAVAPPDSLLFPSFASRRDSFYTLILRGGNNSSLTVGENAHNVQRQHNLVNNISVTKGSHQLKFGFDYRRLTPTFSPRKYDQEVTVEGITGALSGQAAEVFIQTQYTAPTSIFNNVSAFAQDTWRISPRLSLTYGLRWEHNPPPTERDGNDPFTVVGLDNPATMTLAPSGTRLWKVTYGDFAPRLGVVHQLSEKGGWRTVLRGGVGLFYDLGSGLAANAAGFGIFPYSRVKFLFNAPYPLAPASAEPPAFSLNPPYGFLFVYEPDLKLPRTYQWNFALEQSLGAKNTVTATYVGAAGRRLLRQELLVQPNPDFDFVFVTRNSAKSDYHALQLQFQRSLSHGLQVFSSYTWSHSLDTISNETSFFNVPSPLIDLNRERGPSDFDVRHAFTATAIYNLPAPPLGPAARLVLRDWSLDTVVRLRTALPVDVVTGTNFLFGFFAVRPNLISGTPVYVDDSLVAGGRRINRAAFVSPLPDQQGNLGRNALRGFGLSQIDLALRRQFALTKRVGVQLRAEAFNLFNHPNFANPVNDLNNVAFGQATQLLGRSLGSGSFGGGFNPLYQVGGPRSLQLVLRLQF